MSGDRIEADYLLETPIDPRIAAEIIAGEQSSGTFVPVPGETPELKARSAARVIRLDILDEDAAGPALPGASPAADGRFRRALVTLSWPLETLGPSLPNLVATVAGNLFELKAVSGLRLLDIRMPSAFAAAYRGPQFGIAGTRRLAGVDKRAMIGTIVKPSVGFSAEETASLVRKLCEAGIDFIKDDELQADGPACPFADRVKAVMRVIEAEADRTGKKTMYAFNLTGDLDQMRRRHDHLVESGATCLMASLNSVGLVGMIELARFSTLPIHAHRNGWGYLARHPMLGWSYVAWQKIWRLAGADHMHVNGLQNKFFESDASVMDSARTCLTPLFPEKPCIVMPVFSSGQSARQAPATYAGLGSTDLIVTAGGGIMGHPDGPAAGVTALKEAWAATVAGISLEEHARAHPELGRALEVAA
ncbi:ribulose-bisphosphate carboxylase large chain [Xanthobacter flavus]|uniref:Ribulose bisphosphate carboxylaseoxygenase large subunit n=1 Tax=Xanthobacter flavus TaxID=281 RepID=A0A9W6CSN2_XANFL|nr:ribulose-bisphosphate carboxylase large subunit family protein [Xanthobacter flavus]MBN8918099.1 ribulose-bisphosphate carboxylase large subunit family protein [Hyphomicrobiales bacterium]MDR6336936.1 ribulose-bisphosphate carboxylase large chain [Xanthobacter flavus]GLI25690.1 ribulose bisphosphate carboxylaseoxygenase large subunit [Xanthobacter flavus]